MGYWQILVLAAVRLGCNLDYDKLQDLAEQHRALRHIMGIGDWDEVANFSWRRIRDNVCLLQPQTIEQISHLIVAAGQHLVPEAVQKMRADSFVVETNIHYPTESSLIFDGLRVILGLCVELAALFGQDGWRQHEHLLKKAKRLHRSIQRISSRKGPNYQQRLKKPYRSLLKQTEKILRRARHLSGEVKGRPLSNAGLGQLAQLETFIGRTEQVCGTARRRVLKGEKVPNSEKLFSMFEPHTQLYKPWQDAVHRTLTDGRTFAAVLRGHATTHRKRIFTTQTGDGRMNIYPSRAIRTSEWKLIHNLHPEFAFTTHMTMLRRAKE